MYKIILYSCYLTDISAWREITVCFSFLNFLYGKLQVVYGILNLKRINDYNNFF